MQTGRQLNAHFTNIQLFNFDPSSSRLPHDFYDQIDHRFLEKYSLAYYHPQSIKKRKILNERKAALERQREFDEVMADQKKYHFHRDFLEKEIDNKIQIRKILKILSVKIRFIWSSYSNQTTESEIRITILI
jgi:hypothetical protein